MNLKAFSQWLDAHPCDTNTLWAIQNCLGTLFGFDHPMAEEAKEAWACSKIKGGPKPELGELPFGTYHRVPGGATFKISPRCVCGDIKAHDLIIECDDCNGVKKADEWADIVRKWLPKKRCGTCEMIKCHAVAKTIDENSDCECKCHKEEPSVGLNGMGNMMKSEERAFRSSLLDCLSTMMEVMKSRKPYKDAEKKIEEMKKYL